MSLAALVLALAPGCLGDAPLVPQTLIDGSRAQPPPVVLEGLDGAGVGTEVRVRRADAVPANSRSAACIASIGVAADGMVIERVGVSGMSISFFGPGRRAAHACDASVPGSGNHPKWCGRAFGRADAGRLRDPRLSLSCRDAKGKTLGFTWVQPAPDAAYVVVHQPHYSEVYAAAGRSPVRVTTSAIDLATSTATFSVSEHGSDGRRLRAYTVEAQVAG